MLSSMICTRAIQSCFSSRDVLRGALESADWNQLLSESSSNAVRKHAELIEFLRNSDTLVPEENLEELRISKNLLRPTFSTITYRCETFSPKTFHEGLPDKTHVHAAWYNEPASLVYFVTRKEERVRWSRSKKIADRQWDLYVLFHDKEAGLPHVNHSDKDSLHEGLAEAVGGTVRIDGEQIFRSLGSIRRLSFNNIGVRKHGRRSMSFAMYTGADVRAALTLTKTTRATKSNLDGRGWEGGQSWPQVARPKAESGRRRRGRFLSGSNDVARSDGSCWIPVSTSTTSSRTS